MISVVATLAIVALSGAGSAAVDTTQGVPETVGEGLFLDPRDGIAYRTVRVGTQLWLGENVRFEQEGAWVYGEDPANLEAYGRLYDWEGASCACPPGWHLPEVLEWEELFEYLGGRDCAGGHLKEVGTVQWKSPNSAATNSSRFDGRPGGGRRPGAGTYHGLGMFGAFWGDKELSRTTAWAFLLGYHYPEVSVRESTSKGFGFSVRCVHD